MKRTMTTSLGWIGLTLGALLYAPGAWAQAGGAGGEAGDSAAAGVAGEASTPGAAGAPGEPAAAGAPGAAGAGAGEAGSGNEGGAAGAPPKPEVPPPNEYDLLENDGGKACSIGGPGSTPGAITMVLGAALGAAVLRRRNKR